MGEEPERSDRQTTCNSLMCVYRRGGLTEIQPWLTLKKQPPASPSLVALEPLSLFSRTALSLRRDAPLFLLDVLWTAASTSLRN